MVDILLISRCPPYPLHLGDRLIIWHLARELSRRHTIDLIAFANQPSDWHEIAQYQPYFRNVTLIPEPQRSAWHYAQRLLWPGKRFPLSAEGAWSPVMWQAITQHVRQYHYDLAHLFGGIQVYEYHHALGQLPALITPYESYSLYLRRMVQSQPGLYHRLQQRIAQQYETFMFQPYAKTVVVAEPDRAELLALNPSLPVTVIPNGVDLDYFQPLPVSREPATLLFTGNYEYAPNADAARRLVHEILPRLQATIPSIKLWLVGNAPTAEMQSWASDNILVPGRVPDMRPWLAQATVFVSPLRQGAGIKNKVLEALAMGCPLVATTLSVDGIAVTNGQDALIAEENDALIHHIQRLLADAPLQQQLSHNGQQLIASDYSWAGVATQYALRYAQIAAQPGDISA